MIKIVLLEPLDYRCFTKFITLMKNNNCIFLALAQELHCPNPAVVKAKDPVKSKICLRNNGVEEC